MAKNNEINTISTNMIASGTSIVGDITCNNDIRFEGSLVGNLDVKGKVVIGATGVIKGEVRCQNCDIEGTLEGKIIIQELLCLRATARVTGDMHTNKLAIEPGALFSGICKMSNGDAQAIQQNGMAKKEGIVEKA
jgi:cytoskeletal protein CcmA (bactofilin family)